MYCGNCGSELDEGAAFCGNCGAPVAGIINGGDACNELKDSLEEHNSMMGTPAPSSAAVDESGNARAAFQPVQTGTSSESPLKSSKKKVPKWIPVCAVAVIVGVVLGGGAALGLISLPSSETSATSTSEPVQEENADFSSSESQSSESREQTAAVTVTVPDVTGMTLNDATAALHNAGLSLGTVANASGASAQTVESSSPAAGASVERDSSISLTMKADSQQQQQSQQAQVAPVQSHRYELVMQECTWQEASQYAKDKGGYLARVDSEEEWNQILKVLPQDKKAIWLGGERVNGTFVWEDGTPLAYSNWASTVAKDGSVVQEPNNDGGNENYLAAYYAKDASGAMSWMWFDVPNDISPYYKSSTIGYLVEYDS